MYYNNLINGSFNNLIKNLKNSINEVIYLYGCGEHTRGLLEVLQNNNIKIEGLIDKDDSGLVGKNIYDYTVNNITEINNNNFNKIVVISSFDFQNIIYERIRSYESDKLKIIKIYKSTEKSYDLLEYQETQRWERENGEKKRYDYNLNENSIVFDLGGYKGEWTKKIFSKFNSIIYVFEPVKKYHENMMKEFYNNDKIMLNNFALGKENSYENIYLNSDGSSIYNKYGDSEEMCSINIKDFLINNNISNIDLMKINIEGGEYDLLEYMIDEKIINKIDNIQIQFHSFVPNAEERMKSIQDKLRNTHYSTYQYRFIFENWCRIKKNIMKVIDVYELEK